MTFLFQKIFRKRRGIMALGMALAAVLGGWALLWLDSPPPHAPSGIVDIPQGHTARQVARQLKKENHIRSARWFLFLAGCRGATERLQKGAYELSGQSPASRVLADLVTGRTLKARVTIPEGFASWDIAARLKEEGVCDQEAFQQLVSSRAAEGYLFPDTYFLDFNTPPEKALEVFLHRFENVWNEVLAAAQKRGDVVEVSTLPAAALTTRLADGRRMTKAEVVVLASVMEREVLLEEEYSLVSAVFHNRLRKRMRLESDPTVQFSLGYWKPRILYKDLEVDSPYNTYRRFGLPPGPICSPGKSALAAALSPAKVDYLYFVANGAGGHDFARTFREHRQNVRNRNRRRREKS